MTGARHQQRNWLLAWLIWIIAVLYYLYEYVQRIAPAVMVDDLMRDFHVTAAGVGNLNALYFYAYALFQIPVGYLADRYGPKRPLLIASVICSVSGFFFSIAHHLFFASMARSCIGIGSAFGYICCLRLTINWFPRKQFALMCGLVNMVGLVGAVIGEVSLGYWMDVVTWRSLIFYLSLTGLLISLFVLIFVKDFPPKESSHHPLSPSMIATPFLKTFAFIVTRKQVWFLSFFVATAYCSFDTLAAFWGVPYLQGVYGVSKVQAASVGSLIFIGGIVGFLFFGAFTSWYEYRHRCIMIVSSSGLLLVSFILLFQPNYWWVISLLFFCLGFFSGTVPTATDLLKMIVPKQISGLTISVLNTTLVAVGAISQPLFGYLLERSNPSTTTLSDFTAHDFHRAFYLMPILFGISCLCAILTKQKTEQVTSLSH